MWAPIRNVRFGEDCNFLHLTATLQRKAATIYSYLTLTFDLLTIDYAWSLKKHLLWGEIAYSFLKKAKMMKKGQK